MHYYIDGYNLLFRITKSYEAMKANQKQILSAINTWVIQLNLNVTIVFDGRQKDPPEAIRGHLDQLEVIYTPEHQTADDYILHELDLSSNLNEETVVSSDRELTGKAKQKGARTQSVDEFLSGLVKKRKKKQEPMKKTFRDTDANIERLHEIFEDRLKDDDDPPFQDL